MGPTSVDVGGRLASFLNRRARSALQWGRHQSMSEGRSPWCARARSKRFNGADISRCRRVVEALVSLVETGLLRFNGADISRCRRATQTPRRSPRSPRSFNGADISRCRRVGPSVQASRWIASALQWGRHQSMSEGAALDRRYASDRTSLQWGRHQSMSEGAAADPVTAKAILASMGPTSVDVGGLRTLRAQPREPPDASMGPTSVDVGGLAMSM